MKNRLRKEGGGRKLDYPTPEKLKKAIDGYLVDCKASGDPLTITGLTLSLGFSSRQSLYNYAEKIGYEDVVNLGRLHVEHAYEIKLHGNYVTGPIFALKNMGWKDTQHQEIQQENKTISDTPETESDWIDEHGA